MENTATATSVSILQTRPRYEGANIRSWIGFKHFMYLAEDAVLQWLRDRQCGPQAMFERCGLGFQILDSSVFLPSVMELDDVVDVEVTPPDNGQFTIKFTIARNGTSHTALKGKLRIAFLRETPALEAPPPLIAALVRDLTPPASDTQSAFARRAFVWSWKARYFYCQYSRRVQHSAYVRALEEVVARFLEDRGLAVGDMLQSHGWIPVVSRARVQILADAFMEEEIQTRFHVEELLKRTAFIGHMNCYVRRGDTLIHTATARIVHGYAVTRGPQTGSLAEFDDDTVAALTREM